MADLLLSTRYLTIHHQDTLLVTTRQGWIGGERTGLFSRDTRYLSTYRLTLNGFEPRLLGASRPHYFAATFYYTNPRIGAEPHAIPENSLLLKVSRFIREGVHEDVELTNYAGKLVELTLLLEIGADFADIFQVRQLARFIPRLAQAHWDGDGQTLSIRYRKGDLSRTLHYRLHHCATPPTRSPRSITFRITLAPGETWHTCADIHFEDKPAPGHPDAHTLMDVEAELHRWQATLARVETPVAEVNGANFSYVGNLRGVFAL
ncbi:MAG: hypothetical protein HY331_09310 [Chloroflexi bacterium]|nr:hypothetical protein [Chloroflexota bacterium]